MGPPSSEETAVYCFYLENSVFPPLRRKNSIAKTYLMVAKTYLFHNSSTEQESWHLMPIDALIYSHGPSYNTLIY